MDYDFHTDNDDYIIINPSLKYKIEDYNDNYVVDGVDDIILPFKTNDLIKSIKYSYNTTKNILDQFKIDMLRTKIYHNNKQNIIDYKELYGILNTKFNTVGNVLGNQWSLNEFIVLLTQSVYVWPYKMIHHKYCVNFDKNNKYNKYNIHLGEICHKKLNKLYKRIIKQKEYESEIENTYVLLIDRESKIIIFKRLRVFYIDKNGNDITLRIVSIELDISLENKISILKIY